MKVLKPSLYLGGFDYFLGLWKDGSVKDKGILVLMFAPMFFCLAGLIFSIIYFVLFVLPSYLFTFIGWALLTALFGMGGKYFYSYLTNRPVNEKTSSDFIDVEVVAGKTAETEKNNAGK